MATVTSANQPDVVLIGAGIMSGTLAVLLKKLDPRLNIQLHEVLGSPALGKFERMEQRGDWPRCL